VTGARIAHHVDDLRAVAQSIELIEREEAHAGVIRLRAQDAIQLDGVADGFVNLQPQLRAIENQIELALGTLVGRVQSDGLFGDARLIRVGDVEDDAALQHLGQADLQAIQLR
jgi:hypothetical protein